MQTITVVLKKGDAEGTLNLTDSLSLISQLHIRLRHIDPHPGRSFSTELQQLQQLCQNQATIQTARSETKTKKHLIIIESNR